MKTLKVKIGDWTLWAEPAQILAGEIEGVMMHEEYCAALVRDNVMDLARNGSDGEVFALWRIVMGKSYQFSLPATFPEPLRLVCAAYLKIYTSTRGIGIPTLVTDESMPRSELDWVRDKILGELGA